MLLDSNVLQKWRLTSSILQLVVCMWFHLKSLLYVTGHPVSLVLFYRYLGIFRAWILPILLLLHLSGSPVVVFSGVAVCVLPPPPFCIFCWYRFGWDGDCFCASEVVSYHLLSLLLPFFVVVLSVTRRCLFMRSGERANGA